MAKQKLIPTKIRGFPLFVAVFMLTLVCGLSYAKTSDHQHDHAHHGASHLQAPEGLSEEEYMKWEIAHIVPEHVLVSEDKNKIYVNNKVCPLKRNEIRAPYNQIITEVKYQGQIEKFKGKTFVFNFCCGQCQSRFPEHFKKFPDLILKKYNLI